MSWDEDVRAVFPDWATEVGVSRWPEIRSRVPVGQEVVGTVIARAPFGVWLDIGAGWPALLLVPDMENAKQRSISFDDYPLVGALVASRICGLGDRGQIALTQHPINQNEFGASNS